MLPSCSRSWVGGGALDKPAHLPRQGAYSGRGGSGATRWFPLGLQVQIVADLGAYFLMSTPTVPLLTSYRLARPYTTPAMHVKVRGVITNKPPTGANRGVGGRCPS